MASIRGYAARRRADGPSAPNDLRFKTCDSDVYFAKMMPATRTRRLRSTGPAACRPRRRHLKRRRPLAATFRRFPRQRAHAPAAAHAFDINRILSKKLIYRQLL